VTAREARQKADDYVQSQFHVNDFSKIDVRITESATSWTVIYSARNEGIGGPLVIGVDKKSGRTYLVEGFQ
jgi:hypothetical protein